MKITILTLFPEMFDGFLSNSIIKRAISKGVVSISIINIRDYTKNKYGRVDTPPIGGGAGLIMQCQPIYDCLAVNKTNKSHVILMSAKGNTFNQKRAKELSQLDDIVLICGHYEGIDARIENYVDEQISVGDFILTGGEIPSMLISDSIIRLLDGAITKESLSEESFENGALEYPQYTEPYDFKGQKVPDILYSGNHKAIEKYRRKKALEDTKKFRPDLFEKLELSKQDKKLLQELENDETPSWEEEAIQKGKKFLHN